jgi:pSer/pThr/pTyr-binding forkhead associated (FHA) protein
LEKGDDNVTKIVYVVVKSGPLEGHKYIVKSDTPILVGRSEEANIRIAYDEFCSRRHAQIYWQNEKCYINDLESTNGTLVNEIKIQGTFELNNNDIIKLGNTELIVSITDYKKDKTNPEDDISFED